MHKEGTKNCVGKNFNIQKYITSYHKTEIVCSVEFFLRRYFDIETILHSSFEGQLVQDFSHLREFISKVFIVSYSKKHSGDFNFFLFTIAL